MLESVNPANGEVIAAFPVHGRRDVDAAVARAAAAFSWWAGLGWDGRRQRLLAWKSHLARYLERLAQLIHTETGKPLDEARLEILLTIAHIDWAARHARSALRSRRVRGGLAALDQAARVEYQPLGVIGVIGPRDDPVLTPAGPIASALAAGNAVVFKPSELTPAVGTYLARSFGAALDVFDPDAPAVLQTVTGPGATGEALARSGVAKIAFTGSPHTARLVMAAAAETLTPVIAECGDAGESGLGRIHRPDALRAFSRARAITRQRTRPLVRLATAGSSAEAMDRLVRAVTLLHGRLYQPSRPGPGPLGRRVRAGRARR